MRFEIEKPKVRKGFSYALQSSMLKEAIDGGGLDCNVHLVYWTPQLLGSIVEAHYWLPNENVDYDRFYIRAGVVRAEERAESKAWLSEVAIPELIRRMTFIMQLPTGSNQREAGLFFDALRVNGQFVIK